jgi:DNA-binding response OmpR family regulator
LEEAGYAVVVAEDGEEAVRQVIALHPNVVLLELILPKQDGFSVLKTVKADPTVSDIPVLVLTSLSQESDIAEARNCGAADVMIKTDVSLNDVLLSIDRLLAKS